MASVVKQVIERLLQDAPPEQVRRLLTAAYVLTGLRVPRRVANQLFQGVRAMQESDTYLAIVDEGIEKGSLKEARKLVLRLGRKPFGPPDESVIAAVESITDLERLEHLCERISEVKSWQELLATP